MFTEEQMIYLDKWIQERVGAELKKYESFLDGISDTNERIRAVGQLAHSARPEMIKMDAAQVADMLCRTGETIEHLCDEIGHWLSEIEFESR